MSPGENETTGNVARDAQNSEPSSEGTRGQDENFDAELERRLQILESSDYDDPGRRDLPGLDYVLLATIIIVTVVAMYWWGY